MGLDRPLGMTRAGEPTAVFREQALAALRAAYGDITETVMKLTETDATRPSRCPGWWVADIVHHLLLDAQRALVAFATPTTEPANLDYVSYWKVAWRLCGLPNGSASRSRADAAAHERFMRLSAAAYPRFADLADRWAETSSAALRAAAAQPADARLTVGGHVLSTPDFITTLAVEGTIHHLDLNLDGHLPSTVALTMVRRTLDGLLGSGTRRPDWSDLEYALKGTGRVELDHTERALLACAADRFPLLH